MVAVCHRTFLTFSVYSSTPSQQLSYNVQNGRVIISDATVIMSRYPKTRNKPKTSKIRQGNTRTPLENVSLLFVSLATLFEPHRLYSLQ